MENEGTTEIETQTKKRYSFKKIGVVALTTSLFLGGIYETGRLFARSWGHTAGDEAGVAFAHSAKKNLNEYISEGDLTSNIATQITQGTDNSDLPPFAQDLIVGMVVHDPSLLIKLEKKTHADINKDGYVGTPNNPKDKVVNVAGPTLPRKTP